MTAQRRPERPPQAEGLPHKGRWGLLYKAGGLLSKAEGLLYNARGGIACPAYCGAGTP